MRTSRLLIALVLGVASTCFAQAPTWTQKCLTTSPPARYATRMAYDAGRGQLVMFGGGATIPSSIIFDDTWVWDGVSWTQKFPATNPPPKSSQSTAYDAARQQVVMFGGTIGNAISADTWVWDGINWTQKFPANSPSARLHADMAYDAAHQQVVLFGGGPGDPSSFADTWVWDGTNWTQKFPTTSPPARSGHRMAYDTARGQIVLFAGRGGSDGNTFFSDTWVWDGTNWTQKFPATSPPTPRFQYGLAYDAAQQQVVLFGGQGPNNTPIYNDTWVWDGTAWIQQLPATIPPGRTLPAMAYDAAHAQVVLFGGFTGPGGLSGSFANDTWVWGAPASTSCPAPISSLGSGTSGGSSATSAGDKLDTQGKTNEPISTGNGNYYFQHTDFTVPGRGMPLVFQRSYNSLDNYAGPLGANWTHSYNVILSQPVTGTVIVKWGDGHGETFTLSGGNYVAQPGVFNTLTKNLDGTFTLSRKDQTQFAFSAGGAVTSIRDKNGNTTNLAYDLSGNLIQITDTVGRNLVFAYDASNRITQITDPIGRTVSFQYDPGNNLVQANVFTSSFAYDGDGNRFGQSTSRGTYNYLNDVGTALPVVLQESGPDGNISYAYGLGLISESSPTFNYFYHYDGLGSVMALTDASGAPKAGYAYDPWGNPLINVSDSVGTKNKFRFTGEALDPGTGLYYLRARYYDPAFGRFMGRDPFPGFAAIPIGTNLYSYVQNNPIAFVDPTGLISWFPAITGTLRMLGGIAQVAAGGTLVAAGTVLVPESFGASATLIGLGAAAVAHGVLETTAGAAQLLAANSNRSLDIPSSTTILITGSTARRGPSTIGLDLVDSLLSLLIPNVPSTLFKALSAGGAIGDIAGYIQQLAQVPVALAPSIPNEATGPSPGSSNPPKTNPLRDR
jgi:RHS repeat-associated protein